MKPRAALKTYEVTTDERYATLRVRAYTPEHARSKVASRTVTVLSVREVTEAERVEAIKAHYDAVGVDVSKGPPWDRMRPDEDRDPMDDPEYQKFLAETAKRCISKYAPCAGCCAGGMCDNFDGIEEREDRDCPGYDSEREYLADQERLRRANYDQDEDDL